MDDEWESGGRPPALTPEPPSSYAFGAATLPEIYCQGIIKLTT